MTDRQDTVNLKDYLLAANERDELRAENERLRAEVRGWHCMWNDAEFLSARVEALRDGTADLGSSNGA